MKEHPAVFYKIFYKAVFFTKSEFIGFTSFRHYFL